PENEGPASKGPKAPSDYFVRANYGAWLIGLGFLSSAAALREYRANEQASEILLPCLELNGAVFAFTAWGLGPGSTDFIPFWFGSRQNWPKVSYKDRPRILLTGIEVGALESISNSVRPATIREPLPLRQIDGRSAASEGWSVFSDGTLLGEFDLDELSSLNLHRRAFIL